MYAKYAPSHELVKNPVWGPHKILCTCGAKWHQNSDFLWEGDPKRYFRTFWEKEHTSKRVSIIAPDNAISKAKLCD